MRYLLDTNILLRFNIPTSSQGNLIQFAVSHLQNENHDLFVAIQNLAEFWNVVTRPISSNGIGASLTQAHTYLLLIEESFELVSESFGSHIRWRKLLMDFGISGVQVHDARLVSVMLENNIDRILTLNTQDFQRFQKAGIEAIHPNSLVTN